MRQLLFLTFFLALRVTGQNIINTVAGTGTYGYSGDGGPALSAEFKGAQQLVFDAAGNYYIIDAPNAAVRKVTPAGIITTIAGNGFIGWSGDGGPAVQAQIAASRIAIDQSGNLYLCGGAPYHVVRKISTSGIITTIAGNGSQGYSGDGGLATSAQLYDPWGITIDASGNVYIADAGNNVIRKVSSAGIITTIAGTGTAGYGGDGGPATSAMLYIPQGLTIKGNILYFADRANERVRSINLNTGIINTIAGTGSPGFSGDGGPASAAQVSRPWDVMVDQVGDVYVADYFNARVRKINSSGIISTIVGNGLFGFSGDGGPALNAEIGYDVTTAMDATGNLYIADTQNGRIRKVNLVNEIKNIDADSLTIYPVPCNDILYVNSPCSTTAIAITDPLGQVIVQKTHASREERFAISHLKSGLYFIFFSSEQGIITRRIIKE